MWMPSDARLALLLCHLFVEPLITIDADTYRAALFERAGRGRRKKSGQAGTR
jgi:hypothetical protein